MKSVIALGESIVDFTPDVRGIDLKNVESFVRNCGGAPGNVASAVARLGGDAKFISQVGNDAFGEYIKGYLTSVGVDCSHVFTHATAKTALSFVSLDEYGDRQFCFYRNGSADTVMKKEQIHKYMFNDIGALHFGSVNLSTPALRDLHRKAIYYAKHNNAIISFDPNIRLNLWNNHTHLKKVVNEFMHYCNIAKISDSELEFITDECNVNYGIRKILSKGVRIILFTSSRHGSYLITKHHTVHAKNLPVTVEDTTGAGDAIIGALLYMILLYRIPKSQLSYVDERAMQKILNFANAYANFSVTKSGAVASYANMSEIREFLKLYKIEV